MPSACVRPAEPAAIAAWARSSNTWGWTISPLGNDPRDPNSGGDSGFSVLDFGLFSTFRDTLSRGTYANTGQVLAMDWIYERPDDARHLPAEPRRRPRQRLPLPLKGEQWMAAAAYNLIWTVRGIPCRYYGEGIEFMKGAPQDVIGERDTLDQTGRAYFGDHLMDDRIATTQSHALYRHLRRLNAIRRAIPALQKARMRQVSDGGQGLSFVRDLDDGASYAVVGLAIGSDQDVTVSPARNGLYRDAVSGREVRVGDGRLSFHVHANSAGIYVLDGPGKIGDDEQYLR